MEKRKSSVRYAPEVRARAVRMVQEHGGDHASQWAAIGSIAAKIGCTGETLRKWVRQAERDQGARPGPTTEERERIKVLEREVRELRQANEILRKASAYFARRSSTAGSSHDRVHRRSPRRLRGRADLTHAADRPVDLPRPCRAPGGSQQIPGPYPTRRRIAAGDPARVGVEFPDLRGAQGLAPAAPRGDRRGPLHHGAADAADGAGRRDPWPNCEDDAERPRRAMSARPGEPAIPGAETERVLGFRLHLRRHLAGLRQRRHRRLRAPHRRLARVAFGAGRLRVRRPAAGAPRAAASPARRPRASQRSRGARRIQAIVAAP